MTQATLDIKKQKTKTTASCKETTDIPKWKADTLITVSGETLTYEVLSEFIFGKMVVRYLLDPVTRQVGLSLVPISKLDATVSRSMSLRGNRETDGLPDHMADRPAWKIFNLIQLKLQCDSSFQGGGQVRSVGNSETTLNLKFSNQEVFRNGLEITVVTEFKNTKTPMLCRHYLSWTEGNSYLILRTEVENISDTDIVLENLSSFTLTDLSPFCESDPAAQLSLHRYRSNWSGEARHYRESLDQMHISNVWTTACSRGRRFGQVGSWPTCDFFPFIGIEDSKENVTWAAQLWHPGSWQMAVVRYDNAINIVGGLADQEFGHWSKKLKPCDIFSTPVATLTVSSGDMSESCDNLLEAQQDSYDSKPYNYDDDMAIMYNEWATSWGEPAQDNLLKYLEKLKDTPVKYLVIDAGWYRNEEVSWNTSHGDWNPSKNMFPEGLKVVADKIRDAGIIPGLWFEMETCARNSEIFKKEEFLIHKDGRPLTVGPRRFIDLCKSKGWDYLCEKVIKLLKDTGMGYIKVDYNSSIGIGCDGAESYGEALRQQTVRSRDFFEHMRNEIPELVIENCASGGMRLEPSMMAVSDVASFTDAHECREIPVIAASLHRLILPRQNGVWVIIRKEDSLRQLLYILCSGFLGRFYLSGDICDVSEENWSRTLEAMELYGKVAHIIKNGKTYIEGSEINNYRDLKGWQAVTRLSTNRDEALMVIHCFGIDKPQTLNVKMPVEGCWSIENQICDESMKCNLDKNCAEIQLSESFSAGVYWLKRR
ncbi:MAG: glycoside hydrolase family 36 protein [Sedimentisphaeraceae bacterium JB056]